MAAYKNSYSLRETNLLLKEHSCLDIKYLFQSRLSKLLVFFNWEYALHGNLKMLLLPPSGNLGHFIDGDCVDYLFQDSVPNCTLSVKGFIRVVSSSTFFFTLKLAVAQDKAASTSS